MENQHRHITGYRELTAEEIALINKIKAHALETEALLNEVNAHLNKRLVIAKNQNLNGEGSTEIWRIDAAQPVRWHALARTDLQTGLMKLIRAVAQPTTF